MKIAALYDIHANFPALEATLAEVQRLGADLIVVGGDVVPGPMPHPTIGMLQALDVPVRFIHGNGDRVVLAQRSGRDINEVPSAFRDVIRWTAEQIDDSTAQWMATWPSTLRLHVHGLGDVLFCHATPRNDTDIFTKRTPEAQLAPFFEGLGVDCVVCGHTHMQFDRMVGRTRVVNAGSVGMPFQPPGAYWLLIDGEPQLKHTTYDVAACAEAIRRTLYPQAADFSAHNVLNPPAEHTMVDVFAKVEVGA